MHHSNFAGKLLAAALLVTGLLSVTALAAPADNGSTTDILLPGSSVPTAGAQASSGIQSSVSVSSAQATGTYTVVYQTEDGTKASSTVTAYSPTNVTYGYVSAQGDGLRVRQGPGTNYDKICSLVDGTTLPITGKTSNGWYQISVNGRVGYVYGEYFLEKNSTGTPATPPTPSTPPATIAPPASFNGELAQRIVNYALQFEGYPYVYATAGPDTFDCSGFTSYVYKQFGYTLNRSSKDQVKNGVAVSRNALQPADIILFSGDGVNITHVGMYIGNNKIIHASTPVRGVVIDRLDSDYYTSHYYAARRII